jgi:hypothetical protein
MVEGATHGRPETNEELEQAQARDELRKFSRFTFGPLGEVNFNRSRRLSIYG